MFIILIVVVFFFGGVFFWGDVVWGEGVFCVVLCFEVIFGEGSVLFFYFINDVIVVLRDVVWGLRWVSKVGIGYFGGLGLWLFL